MEFIFWRTLRLRLAIHECVHISLTSYRRQTYCKFYFSYFLCFTCFVLYRFCALPVFSTVYNLDNATYSAASRKFLQDFNLGHFPGIDFFNILIIIVYFVLLVSLVNLKSGYLKAFCPAETKQNINFIYPFSYVITFILAEVLSSSKISHHARMSECGIN